LGLVDSAVRKRFDIIVVGGGHAGAEAAWAAAKLGASVALVTMTYDAIARMSCNPAIGGLGKGQMVREIDALGGIMGLAADRAGIQFRMLNRSEGAAVWAPRSQSDNGLYPKAVQQILATERKVEVIEGIVERVITRSSQPGSKGASERRVRGVVLEDGRRLRSEAVILTTGTFLRAMMHCGESKTEGGRVGEQTATGMSKALVELGFELGRLKTGTPPRVRRDSVDFAVCEIQPGDDVPVPFSDMTDAILQEQVPCWITWTNIEVHELIRKNLHRAPMYSGQIESTGPRYCPSIEDKIVRFADKSRHQIFLEPEGYQSDRIYCNGVSTSLPRDVQEAFIARIPGLQRAEILQYGYAVEYDFVPTHQTQRSLETKRVAGLYLAGQINGTSGYEEAAAQGLVAGVNASHAIAGKEPFVLGRDEAYIGVMIDDLITRPPSEPYRMFTSRAEYRLRLRADNADQRLTPVGRRIGLVDEARWERYDRRKRAIAAIHEVASVTRLNGGTVADWMRRPEAEAERLAAILAPNAERVFCSSDLDQALREAKYSGYVDRQDRQIERFRKLESMKIPGGTDFSSVSGLRNEAREKLGAIGPATLGQASRISGVNPADITAIWIHLKGRRA